MQSSTIKPSDTYTVSSFINSASFYPLSYQAFSFTENIHGIDFPVKNILQDYIKELKSSAVKISLNDEEYRKYKYKPKLLAAELYNNSELYFILLALNNIGSVKEFNFTKLNVLKVADIDNIIKIIYNSEKKNIDLYSKK